jgi:hypothetical protein
VKGDDVWRRSYGFPLRQFYKKISERRKGKYYVRLKVRNVSADIPQKKDIEPSLSVRQAETDSAARQQSYALPLRPKHQHADIVALDRQSFCEVSDEHLETTDGHTRKRK